MIRKLLLCVLLAAALAATLVPAIAFAGEDDGYSVTVNGNEPTQDDEGWYVRTDLATVYLDGETVGEDSFTVSSGNKIVLYIYPDQDEYDINYTVNSIVYVENGTPHTVSYDPYYDGYPLIMHAEAIDIQLTMARDPNEFVKDGIVYYRTEGTTQAMVYWGLYSLKGVVNILPTVVINGATCTVTRIDTYAFDGCKSITGVTIPSTVQEIGGGAFANTGIREITVPPTVTKIEQYAIGYNSVYHEEEYEYEYTKIPGMIIDTPAGSEASRYAYACGITCVDRAAERAAQQAAEQSAKAAQEQAAALAAWKGVATKGIPKVKGVKVKAAKKKATVSWKKLNKKQLKKSKVTHYEVQWSLKKNFPMDQTVTRFVSKSKQSYNISKLASKKTYYVRVRAIKKKGGVKYVGSWTKTKVKAK